MPNVQVTSIPISGAATAQTICEKDNYRKYIAIIARTGNPTLSIGEGTHSDTAFTLVEGNMFELGVNCISKMQVAGAGTAITVLQDINSNCVLTSDGAVLTSDGEIMTYNRNTASRPDLLSTPTFS